MNKSKRKSLNHIISFCFVIYALFFMNGCNTNQAFMCYDSEKYVDLYDYSQEVVDSDYLKITEEDIEMIIETELSANEAYVEITSKVKAENNDILLLAVGGEYQYYFLGGEDNLEEDEQMLLDSSVDEIITLKDSLGELVTATVCGIYRKATIKDVDFILDYYGYSNWNELERFVRNRASDEIIYNLLFDKITEHSTILGVPKEIQIQIEKEIRQNKSQILENYSSMNDYLNDNSISYEEFESSISQYYYELMIYKSILDNENLTVTNAEVNDYRLKNSLGKNYSDYYIYQQIAFEKVKKRLVDIAKIID